MRPVSRVVSWVVLCGDGESPADVTPCGWGWFAFGRGVFPGGLSRSRALQVRAMRWVRVLVKASVGRGCGVLRSPPQVRGEQARVLDGYKPIVELVELPVDGAHVRAARDVFGSCRAF